MMKRWATIVLDVAQMVSTVVAARFPFSTCIVVLLVTRLAARMVAARMAQNIAIVMAIAFDAESFRMKNKAGCSAGGRVILWV